MASYITFNPPLDKSTPRIEIRDFFFLGDPEGKGRTAGDIPDTCVASGRRKCAPPAS
jgi:hypothetical protein